MENNASTRPRSRTDIGTHVLILGWFNIVASALFAFLAFFALLFFPVIGVAAGDAEALPILSVIGCAGFALLGVFAVPGIFAGWGLLARKPWGRVGGIIMAILHLFNLPIGTAFGIYSLWVLTEREAEEYFAAGASHATFSDESPQSVGE
jgi:hypothetical protein